MSILFANTATAQQYTSERYTVYVGSQLGKYPPTQAGIQAAINSLKDVVDVDRMGVIYLAQNNYQFDSSVQVYPYIKIKGEGGRGEFGLNSMSTITFNPASLSATDSSKNFLFTFNDTLTTPASELEAACFVLENLAIVLDTSGVVKSFSKAGMVYLKNCKTVSTNIQTFIHCYGLSVTSRVYNYIMFYSPGNGSIVKTSRTEIRHSLGFYTLWRNGWTREQAGFMYKEDIVYDATPSRFVKIYINNFPEIHCNLYSALNWDHTAGVVFFALHNINKADLTCDSVAIQRWFSSNVMFENLCDFQYLTLYNGEANYFANCYFFTLKMGIIRTTGTSNFEFNSCHTRHFAWMPGIEINLKAAVSLNIYNSNLIQHATTANVGVINIYDGGKASNVQVRNSGIFSKTSSNLAIYAESATTGTNHIYQSVVGDTVSTNFTYSGNTTNSFISYP
ncbi:MAG: hypothetical protein NUV65_05950 [Candidatus Roizmanbacteria bacterium]|nr:hypothetical protein [Candidatus Roizmanbacteria bacterium]